jgi:5-methylcytosine-specific restriction endonuclease McrA
MGRDETAPNREAGCRPSRRRGQIAFLREQGLSYTAIGRRLGIAKSTVAYHCRRLGAPVDDRCARRYDWKQIQAAVDDGLLKARLLREGLKDGRCESCGIDEWMGKPLSKQLHHVNGDGTDNRLENLQLLCGNCHAQTDNWGGRGVRRKAAPRRRMRSRQ